MGGGLSGATESPGTASQKKPPKSLHCAASHLPEPATSICSKHLHMKLTIKTKTIN